MLVPTIGMEVHAELKSKSKVFSRSKNDFQADVNTNVDALDLAYPGTLPTLNREVIEIAMRASLAFHCKINRRMHFDRKNYFYPDLPKGYQITQNDTPIGYDGYVEIETDEGIKRIGIERIHIEEDTCKSIHAKETLLNYNRAGVPLIEIVSKPEIKSGKEACLYLEALRETLLYLDASDVKMEEGSMRCEANISLKEEDAKELGTKVEIKNIGSISKVAVSINYEIERQKAILESGGKVKGETRRFDDKTETTILMRTKEKGNDYRYLPEPNIPFVTIDDAWYESVLKSIPVLPNEMKKEYETLKISSNNIKTLIANKELNDFYREIYQKTDAVILANLLTGDILSYLNKNDVSLKDTCLSKENMIKLASKLETRELTSKQSKEILPLLLTTKDSLEDIEAKLGIKALDLDALKEIILNVLKQNESAVSDYKNGVEKAFKYLVGQIMKETKGSADPLIINEMLLEIINR